MSHMIDMIFCHLQYSEILFPKKNTFVMSLVSIVKNAANATDGPPI